MFHGKLINYVTYDVFLKGGMGGPPFKSVGLMSVGVSKEILSKKILAEV